MNFMPPLEERNEDEIEEGMFDEDDRVLHDLEEDILRNEADLDHDEIDVVEDFEHDLPWVD